MSWVEDITRFLETRLEEFLKAHPELELQALDDQLHQQELDTARILTQSQREQEQIQQRILAVAEEIKTWHVRVEKAQRAKRPDLVQRAQQREATLLSQGNQLWGQMKGLQERIQQMNGLQVKIKQRRTEIKTKLEAVRQQQQAATAQSTGWGSSWSGSKEWDDLERQFQEFELDQEMKNLRQKGS